jgi:hypothetical protein
MCEGLHLQVKKTVQNKQPPDVRKFAQSGRPDTKAQRGLDFRCELANRRKGAEMGKKLDN